MDACFSVPLHFYVKSLTLNFISQLRGFDRGIDKVNLDQLDRNTQGEAQRGLMRCAIRRRSIWCDAGNRESPP